ncbi:hypothetical protein [Thermodesulfobacterium hveragerdense]
MCRVHQSQKTFSEKKRIILKHIIPFFGHLTF